MSTEEEGAHRQSSGGSSAQSLQASPPPLQIDYARLLLLDEAKQHALMENVDGFRWDLPYLVIPWGMRFDVRRCCMEFQKQFGCDGEDALFTCVAEMLGGVGCEHPRGNRDASKLGFAKLLFIEALPTTNLKDIFGLSHRFAWKDLSFVNSIEHDEEFDPCARFSYEVVKRALCGEKSLEKLLPNPPFQPGWFQKSAVWLREEVEKLGSYTTCDPIQYLLSHSSAIMVVASNDGVYFLKGVCAGSRELEITATVTNLFPMRTASLVAINNELKAFITCKFENYKGASRESMLSELFHTQKESSAKEKELIAGGALSLRPVDIEEMLNELKSDQVFIEAISGHLSKFERTMSGLVKLAQELAQYNLPMCLVHGDFSKRNIGLKETEDGYQQMIFHDWQFAVVGHPLYEFHDMREDWDEVIDPYLKMWGEFESLERCREAYERAKVLGWLPKMLGTLECIRHGDIVKQFGVSLTSEFLEQIMLIMERQVDGRIQAGLLVC